MYKSKDVHISINHNGSSYLLEGFGADSQVFYSVDVDGEKLYVEDFSMEGGILKSILMNTEFVACKNNKDVFNLESIKTNGAWKKNDI